MKNFLSLKLKYFLKQDIILQQLLKNRFLYKDGKEFKDATVLETIEEDGTAYPTRVSFPIGNAKQLTQVGYYSDGDTSWVNEVGLELSNAQKVEVTKDTLKATLKKAENELSGSYTTESLANLHDAIAKASESLY